MDTAILGSQSQKGFVCCNSLKSFRNQSQKGYIYQRGVAYAPPPVSQQFSSVAEAEAFPAKGTKGTFATFKTRFANFLQILKKYYKLLGFAKFVEIRKGYGKFLWFLMEQSKKLLIEFV